MTKTPSNTPTKLLLPQLQADHKVGGTAIRRGEWGVQDPKAFNDVADSLDYKAAKGIENINSVPTVWARPLAVEMALHNDRYPSRSKVIPMWYGMLAAIALKEVWGFPLKAELLELGTRKNQSHQVFARSLYELLPDDRYSLYTFPKGNEQEQKSPWEDLYLFSWNNRPVGMTSPSTIVVPSAGAIWDGLPWWNPQTKSLEPPHPHLNDKQKRQLVTWLGKLDEELRNHNGYSNAIDIISGILRNFMVSLGGQIDPDYKISDNPVPFDVAINRGVLIALNKPIKQEGITLEPQVKLIGSLEKTPAKPLLIIDPAIAKTWNQPAQNISVYEGRTLASFQREDLEKWKKEGKINCLTPDELFLPKFHFLDSEGVFTGSERVMVKGSSELRFQGNPISPLIPINPILLEYFTQEDLTRKVVRFQQKGYEVEVILDLPLHGLLGTGEPQNYRVIKSYTLDEANLIEEAPIVELWPNFTTENHQWQEYYGFYFDQEFGSGTFKVNFPGADKQFHRFKQDRGTYETTRLKEFPTHVECLNEYNNLMGLILLPTPDQIRLAGTWTIGVDFGTSFTNVYVNKGGNIVERFTLDHLHLKVTDANPNTRRDVLFDFFIPEEFLPSEKPFPMSTVLTCRGSDLNKNKRDIQPIFDGRMYIPNPHLFKPQDPWIRTDLKWDTVNLDDSELFLRHLALHLSAIAVKNEVKTIQWSLSYPSAFAKKEKNRYAKVWSRVTEALSASTGITHACPPSDSSRYFRTESLCVAQYFADLEQQDLVSTACVDIGGGTSDISIWLENRLLHQCSIQLAGRHLFSELVEFNPSFLKRLGEESPGDWQDLRGPSFSAKLDVWMKLKAEEWLKNERDRLEDQTDFQGLMGLMGIGFGGLYFYIGTIIASLHSEGSYTEQETPSVYVGGNGSRLLHWLAEGGEFDHNSEVNDLFNFLLTFASGLEDSEIMTKLSRQPKDEVACGLVLSDTKLKGLDNPKDDPIVAGEECEINGETVDYQQRLTYKRLDKMVIPEMKRLKVFLDAFHRAIEELEIEEVTAIEGYQWQRSEGELEPDFNRRLWKATQKELRNILLDFHGNADDLRAEPPFILGLKALLRVLGKQWGGK